MGQIGPDRRTVFSGQVATEPAETQSQKGEIGLQVAFVKFVKNHQAVSTQSWITLQ